MIYLSFSNIYCDPTNCQALMNTIRLIKQRLISGPHFLELIFNEAGKRLDQPDKSSEVQNIVSEKFI